MRLVLDSNAIISLFDDSDDGVKKSLMKASEVIVPVVAYAEVISGAENKTKRATATLASMKALLEMPSTRLAPVTKETAQFYSRIYNQLKKNGTKIPTNDIWVAATVFETGGTLYSADGHFEFVPLLDWIDGR